MLKRIILILFTLSVSGAMAADNEPWWNFGPNCICYSNFSAPRYGVTRGRFCDHF